MGTNERPGMAGTLITIGMGSMGLMLSQVSCSAVPPLAPPPTTSELPTTVSDWVNLVDWEQAERKQVVAVEHDDEHWLFMPHPDMEVAPSYLSPDAQDADRFFAVGVPYILEMINPKSNSEPHDFIAPEFYKAIATYKVRTRDAEYTAPYFDNFEIVPGGRVELYLVPVLPGTYEMWCTIPGHRESGKEGAYTITAGKGVDLDLDLDLEMAEDFDPALAADPRRSELHSVWHHSVLATQTVTLTEFAIEPSEYVLTTDVGYKLSLNAIATNGGQYRYTAADFFQSVVTRSVQDAEAMIRAPYFKAIGLSAGGSTDLYIVPTIRGSYEVSYSVDGHSDAGLAGTIQVE